ncbi:phage portal protein [Paludibacteraceae bacterium OttesenSCG-928-F17]|nr:phage portal protein [Paludibacteraceae bacterium OttesenSCG-928-F17]
MKFSLEISRRKNTNKKETGKRHYEAADKGRRGNSFRLATSTGVNTEVRGAITTLRNRSRHMVRNNGWCKRAVEAITKHTIGEGIQPAPDITFTETPQAKKMWRLWAQTTACDWYEKTTFYGLQEIAMRAIAEGGEVLILRRWVEPTRRCPIPVKLQILEGDHIDTTRTGDTTYTYEGTERKGKARLGVQFDEKGQLAGYWLFEYHPGEGDCFIGLSDSKFYPKEDVLHSFEILRPGQVRGLPFGVASFMKSSDFSDYEDAQLIKQKIAACYSAFVLGVDDTEIANDNPVLDLEPGVIEYLGTGESVEFSNPPSVSDYDPYSSRILQGIASAYGITYEMLTMDYSKVNFTSGRMAKIDTKRNFDSWQYNMIVPQLCTPVWDWFIDACLVAGVLTEIIPADWTAPRVPLLDPQKEITAQSLQIKNGLTTLSEIIRETGREPSELFAEYADDLKKLKELGITVDSIINNNTNTDGEE